MIAVHLTAYSVVDSPMGRASKARQAARLHRQAGGGLIIRPARPDDHGSVYDLLESVAFVDPEEARYLATVVTTRQRGGTAFGARAWVVEGRGRRVGGVIVACPPVEWISTIRGVSDDHRHRLMQRVMEAQALVVADDLRGDRVGHRLLEQAVRHYRAQGYRILLGRLLLKDYGLARYYTDAGFTVLGSGEPLYLVDPLGVVLARPAASHVMQMWMPLHGVVGAQQIVGPNRAPVSAITGALALPADAAGHVLRHADGSVTFEHAGERVTLPAQAVHLLESVRAQPVTEAELEAVAAEAACYGIDPVLVAQIRKSSAALKAHFVL